MKYDRIDVGLRAYVSVGLCVHLSLFVSVCLSVTESTWTCRERASKTRWSVSRTTSH